MELILDILELIFEIVIEGHNKKGKPVHMFWRILMLLIICITYMGLSIGCIYVGYRAFLKGNILMTFVFAGLALILLICSIYEVRKTVQKKKK